MDVTKAKQASELYQQLERVRKNLRAFDKVELETPRVFVMDGCTDECAKSVLKLIREDLQNQLPQIENQINSL